MSTTGSDDSRLAPWAEFDEHAQSYEEQLKHPLRRLLGGGRPGVFLDLKARWLVSWLRKHGISAQGRDLLDFGCGTGLLLESLRNTRAGFNLTGCDISSKVVERAQALVPEARVSILSEPESPKFDRQYDFVTASCVFHHIPPGQRDGIAKSIRSALKPGGLFVIFEHNPKNPMTRKVVESTPMDENAVLLQAAEAERLLRQAGFKDVESRFILFFPPRFSWLLPLEKLLGWLPLGAQYATVGRR